MVKGIMIQLRMECIALTFIAHGRKWLGIEVVLVIVKGRGVLAIIHQGTEQ